MMTTKRQIKYGFMRFFGFEMTWIQRWVGVLAWGVVAFTITAHGDEAAPAHADSNLAARIQRLLETSACVACDLQTADLSGRDLSGVNLAKANLSGADLDHTNLRGADLQGAVLHHVNLENTLLAGANLRDADLSDLDIDQVFESVEIIGTQFEGAKFKYGVVCGPAPTKGGWGCQQQ